MSKAESKRHHRRLPVPADLLGDDEFFALDFSVGGMRLSAKRPIAVGTTVALTLTLLGRPLVVSALVAWCADSADSFDERFQFGVAFLDLSDEARGVLADFESTWKRRLAEEQARLLKVALG